MSNTTPSQDFKIYQIYFSQRQLAGLDPAFIPYDNRGNDAPDEYEFSVFRKAYEAGQIPAEGYVGFLSWKFTQKTKITGDKFLKFCRDNPGYDVYFINPFPNEIYLGNVWQQGEYRHPGMLELTQYIFDQLGYLISLKDDVPRSLRISAYCNYWVGNRRFWDEFMAFCLPVYNYIKNDLPEPYRGKFYSPSANYRSASYFAFIFERLFTTFLATHKVRALGYNYSLEELNTKYIPDGATLVHELQNFERQHPERPQPIYDWPALRASFQLFYRVNERGALALQPQPIGALRRLIQRHPKHWQLQRNPIYQTLSRRLLHYFLPSSPPALEPRHKEDY